MKNQSRSSKSMRTFPEDDASSGSNRFRTMIFLPEYPFWKSSPKIQFSSLKIQFSSTAFQFPRNLLQRLPISEKPSSTAFRFLLYCQNTHTVNILSFCSELLRTSRSLIAIHHTVLQVLKTCMLKWLFN